MGVSDGVPEEEKVPNSDLRNENDHSNDQLMSVDKQGATRD